MTEAQLSRRIQKMLPGVHWQRIENSVGVGCPDLNGCWKGKELWLELKIKGGAKRRPSQNVWHLRRVKAGGSPFLFLLAGKVLEVVKMDASGDWELESQFVFTKNNLAMWLAAL